MATNPDGNCLVRGKSIDQLIRQTGDTLRMLDDGSWEGTVKYKCRWSSVVALAPKRNTARHPDFSVLVCTQCEVSRLKPGIVCELTATYRGFFGASNPNINSREELITNTSEAPIDSHPRFVTDIGGKKGSELHGAIFDDDGKWTGWKADSLYAGVESYLFPSTIYRSTQSVSGRPTSIFNVGTTSGVTTGVVGSPPGAPSGKGWLLISHTWNREGGLYSESVEYMLSGPKGWDSVIYG